MKFDPYIMSEPLKQERINIANKYIEEYKILVTGASQQAEISFWIKESTYWGKVLYIPFIITTPLQTLKCNLI